MTTISQGKRKAEDQSWIEYSQPPTQYVRAGFPSTNLHSGAVSSAVASSNYHSNPAGLIAPVQRHPVKKIHPPAPAGSRVLDKSCARCRIRKVKCDRIYPICANCNDRQESCNLVELAKIKPKASRFVAPAVVPEDARIAILERRLASLESQQPPGEQSRIASGSQTYYTMLDDSSTPSQALQQWSLENQHSSIGPASLDWRLGVPTMAKSLSQHLCEAFFDSCCSHLPAFAFFSDNPPDFRGDPSQLTESAKVAIAVFCSIGARASPHSSLLGIAPHDPRSTQRLLNAGTRRESACGVLRVAAHQSAFESALQDEATILNLAAVLALMQMSIFHELMPKKSRSLVRVALGHFKDLQDSAASEEEKISLRRTFALSLYAGDAITSAYAQKACLITEQDLRSYFDQVGIVIPRFPGEDLIAILDSLFARPAPLSVGHESAEREGEREVGLRTACHLLGCHVYAAQRQWATIAAPPQLSPSELLKEIPTLFATIDIARTGIAHIQHFLQTTSHPHSHTHHQPHNHANDYPTTLIRYDRDLLDLGNMIHVLLERARGDGQLDEGEGERMWSVSCSRVRRGLKCLAFYAQVYTKGIDRHLIFHWAFQLELNPSWTTMAMQKLGEVDGPRSNEEEITEGELGWLIEGMQAACYYMPSAERRLAELSPRFEQLPSVPPPSRLPPTHLHASHPPMNLVPSHGAPTNLPSHAPKNSIPPTNPTALEPTTQSSFYSPFADSEQGLYMNEREYTKPSSYADEESFDEEHDGDYELDDSPAVAVGYYESSQRPQYDSQRSYGAAGFTGGFEGSGNTFAGEGTEAMGYGFAETEVEVKREVAGEDWRKSLGF